MIVEALGEMQLLGVQGLLKGKQATMRSWITVSVMTFQLRT